MGKLLATTLVLLLVSPLMAADPTPCQPSKPDLQKPQSSSWGFGGSRDSYGGSVELYYATADYPHGDWHRAEIRFIDGKLELGRGEGVTGTIGPDGIAIFRYSDTGTKFLEVKIKRRSDERTIDCWYKFRDKAGRVLQEHTQTHAFAGPSIFEQIASLFQNR